MLYFNNHPPASCKEEKERHELIWALEKAGGNRTEAGRLLGVSRVTVWSRMKRYNVTMHPYLERE